MFAQAGGEMLPRARSRLWWQTLPSGGAIVVRAAATIAPPAVLPSSIQDVWQLQAEQEAVSHLIERDFRTLLGPGMLQLQPSAARIGVQSTCCPRSCAGLI